MQRNIDERLASALQRITEKLVGAMAAEHENEDDQAEAFTLLHKKLSDLVRFHRAFIKLQYGDDEFVLRAVCFVEEVMMPSISGPDVSGAWFHFTLQTAINIARPIKGPEGSEGYAFLNELDRGVKQMREMSLLS